MFYKVSKRRNEEKLTSTHIIGQEATVRTGHGTTDGFTIGKRVHPGCIVSPCLFNLYAEDIICNARLDESQAGIKTAGRSINNLRYADDTTLMAESEEELKSLLMRVKEESEKAGLKLSILANRRGKRGSSDKNPVGGACSHDIKRCLLFGRKAMRNLDSVSKSQDITLPTKVHTIKAMVFPVVIYRCESWIIKKVEC